MAGLSPAIDVSWFKNWMVKKVRPLTECRHRRLPSPTTANGPQIAG
jgi:hypothetical protein